MPVAVVHQPIHGLQSTNHILFKYLSSPHFNRNEGIFNDIKMNAIDFEKITKSFSTGIKKKTVITDLTLSVRNQEVFGFLGPNGAGKSTTIKLLLGFIKPDHGSITVGGNNTTKNSNYRHLIGYLPEVPCFYENISAIDTLHFCGRASGMPDAEIKRRSGEILERLDLANSAGGRIKTFSKGMKQRLGLATALLHDPEIYILDEPMSGLDPMGRHLVTDVILELADKGKTVFFSSHILSDVEKLCNRIAILNKGRLLFNGTVDEIQQKNTTLETTFIEIIQQDENWIQK